VLDRPSPCENADAENGDRGALPPSTHHEARAGHKIYPHLLRGLAIMRPNQVWAMDITYSPMVHQFGIAAGFVGIYIISNFYNGRLPHSNLDGRTPDQAYFT
jgi:hypothetical protein